MLAVMDMPQTGHVVPEIKRFGQIVGGSSKLRNVYGLVRKAAKVELPVLIIGETGTGKDLIASEIHRRSARRDAPFVAVNMGALPRDLVASELFGHTKGAFTGASEDKSGRLAEADGGSLFLDEIGTMEEHTQVALLRVLDSHTYRPLGAKNDREVDFRLITATNENLEESIRAQQFREDLYHRLQVLRVNVPPLREIPEDIPMLAAHFLQLFNREYGFEIRSITDDALRHLVRYSWPGNIRELKNVIAQCGVSAEQGEIEVSNLPARILEPSRPETTLRSFEPEPMGLECGNGSLAGTTSDVLSLAGKEGVFVPLGIPLDEVQKTYVLRTLSHCGNNKTKTAKALGMSRKTLYDRLNRWGVRPG